MVEQRTHNPLVLGSSPGRPTMNSWFNESIHQYINEHTHRILWTQDLTINDVVVIPADKFLLGENAISHARKNEISIEGTRYKKCLNQYLSDKLHFDSEIVTFCLLKTPRISNTLLKIKEAYKLIPLDKVQIIVSVKSGQYPTRFRTIQTKQSIFAGLFEDKVMHFDKIV